MGKVLVHPDPSDPTQVRVTIPVRPMTEGTEDEYLQAIAQEARITEPVTILDVSAIPASRAFRMAWELTAGTVAVNMPRARTIKREQLQRLESQKVQALTNSINEADDRNDQGEVARLKNLRRSARGAASRADLDSITNPSDLEAFIPPELA